MKQSKALGVAVLISMMMAGNVTYGAENKVSTVDSQTLFRSQLVQDNKGKTAAPKTEEEVENAAANLPELNSRLRWAAVKTPAELAEEKKAAQRQTKAIPIIITAADIDKERKAKKRGEKADKPSIISPRPIQPPQITSAAPQPVPQKPAVKPAQPAVTAGAIELPPIQPVGGGQVHQVKPQETVALPPITPVQPAVNVPVQTIMDAIVEATSIELVVHEVKDDSVELPAVQPVR